MGINGLWDVLGDGEIISIADYAARHFELHKRPLRIAVDEACWRFTNLTPEQVQKIRDGEPSANPVEKTILWRVLRLLKLNVQLLFVYDGLRKPWKRGKSGGGRVDKELIRLLHQLFDHLKIPYHQAPGEAEAECAALQQRGVVDAVWSDDGDAFMFGCTTLIKQHKTGKERVKDMVKVFTAQHILDKFDLDRESFVLFAALAGGDYDTQGLRGCGPQLARRIARREFGVARAACHVKQHQLPAWREALQETFLLCGKPGMEVPTAFPDFKALGHYRDPAISTGEQLDNLRGLRQGWDRPIDQTKLRVLLRNRFNFWTRGFLKHIAPLYVTRALARATTPEQRAENMQFALQLKRTRKAKPKDGEDAPPSKSEVKVTFCPIPAVEIDLGQQPPEEDWSIWAGKDGALWDPVESVECEILGCLLRHGLPEGGLEGPPELAKRKRKGEEAAAGSSATKKRKAGASTVSEMGDEMVEATGASATSTVPAVPKKRGRAKASIMNETDTVSSEMGPASATVAPKKRGGPKKEAPADAPPKEPRKRGKEAEEAQPAVPSPPNRPPTTFKLPGASPKSKPSRPPVWPVPSRAPMLPSLSRPAVQPSPSRPTVLTLDDSSSESEAEVVPAKSSSPANTRLASNVSAVASPSPLFVSPARVPDPEATMVPGESIARGTLRELRAASGLLGKPTENSNYCVAGVVASVYVPTQNRAPVPPTHEVIDLT